MSQVSSAVSQKQFVFMLLLLCLAALPVLRNVGGLMTVVTCVKSHVFSEMSLHLVEFVHFSSAKHQSGTER